MLYVTGDYYDINAVWQTNITSDVNVMYQLQNEPSADLLALHPDENLTQSVNTGNNQLSNDAAIVDVNPDVIYVEGTSTPIPSWCRLICCRPIRTTPSTPIPIRW